MNKSFQHIFDELEQQRVHLFNLVKDLPSEKFSHVPSAGKWSIGQILTHILVAEEMSLAYMKKKALGINQLKDSGVIASLRLEFLKISQRIPAIKYKAPKVVVARTPPPLEIPELTKRWETHRHELQTFLNGIEDKNTRKLIYKHLVGGRMDARQAMVFFREHINHHWPQIKRLLD